MKFQSNCQNYSTLLSWQVFFHWYSELTANLNHSGIRGVSNDWFKSYLSNGNQHVSINGCGSALAARNCGIPQFSALGLLLFSYIRNNILQDS